MRIASQAAAAWTSRTDPCASPSRRETERIVQESRVIIAALIDLLLGGQVSDNAEAIADQVIGADRRPDADLIEETINAFVAETTGGASPLATVKINRDTLQCPACGTRDKIFEDARGVQHNEIYVEHGRLKIAIDLDAPNKGFVHQQYVCDACQTPVALPYVPEESPAGQT
ncbi:hypothetical protein AB0C84_45715 [Actinomadura sp. NPDC048955]|uniref:hypothetical protein n=1 Tax=Actinomadura sp. NPDC048955 TaxID=3158228 RepID=UPI0033C24CD2